MDAGVGCRGGETTQYVHGVECRGVGTPLGMCTGVGCRGGEIAWYVHRGGVQRWGRPFSMCTGVGCRGGGRLLRRRPEVEVGCLPLLCSTLFFEKGSLT